jgi:D-glycero-D-manno-heptose 1,7-bisphosphate phosphatase
MLTEGGLQDINAEMERQLLQQGAAIDAIYYCPHHPEVGEPPYRCICECRKPKPGMLEQAATDRGIDLSRSYMIGDKLSDLEAGWNAGCRSILVLTGYGREVRDRMEESELGRVSHVAEDLGDAARWVEGQER